MLAMLEGMRREKIVTRRWVEVGALEVGSIMSSKAFIVHVK